MPAESSACANTNLRKSCKSLNQSLLGDQSEDSVRIREESDAEVLASLRENLAAAFAKVLTPLVGVLLFSYLFSMGLGPFLFYSLPQGLEAAAEQVAALPVSVFMVINFQIPFGVNVGLFFVVLWLLYVAAFALAWVDTPGFPSSLRDLSLSHLTVTRSNYLVILPLFASVMFVGVVFLQALQESVGVQTGGISFESPMLGFLAVSYAPFVEEFSYRITTLGLLDGLHLSWKMRRIGTNDGDRSTIRLLILTMWKPERAKQSLGLNTIQGNGIRDGISRFEWVVLMVTSGAFGAVHYLFGGGWDIGKISTAMISGLAMGLVYLRYGAYAPILLHWFFNYYFGAFDLASQVQLAGFDLVAFGVEFLNLGVGTLLAVVLIISFFTRVLALKRRMKQS